MARQFISTIDNPIVETKAGKLRGFILDGIYTFQGIHYAEAERFQAPTPVEPWEGIKNATNYGYISPTEENPAPTSEIFISHRFWPANEHCQNLNIWTPGINDGKKRPVVVWFHGGGFSNGSAIEQVSYEGDHLAEYGDVVVVTVNHRLNILGFLDMSSFGEKYANSANAGIADLVAALQWVHDNIEGFGGDPDNVTIFGQSGGGCKVTSMMQTPAAEGLFHRAMIMSGVAMPGMDVQTGDPRKTVEGILKALNLTVDQVEELETVPYEVLVRAYNKACEELGTKLNWFPQPNDWYLGNPMTVGFTEFSKKIPTIVGSTIAEFSVSAAEKINSLSETELYAQLTAKYGDKTDSIIEELHKAYPGKRTALLEFLDLVVRKGTIAFAQKKAEVSSAPTYLYDVTLEYPVLGGGFAWHCSDIPFFFHNADRVGNCNIEGVTETLEDQMAGAFVSFAYSGNPNHEGLPKWEAVNGNISTMLFDENTRCVDGHDTELIKKIIAVTGEPVFGIKPTVTKEGKAQKDWMY
jgi:para-nitrobenzyl esterase